MDVIDTPGEYRLVAEVPGALKDTLEVVPGPVAGTVSLKVATRPEEASEVRLRNERGAQGGRVLFHRIVPVAWDADAGGAKTELADGLLVVRVPKKTKVRPEPSKRDVA